MTKAEFNERVQEGINRGKLFMVVKIETEGNPAPEIIVNGSENFKPKTGYYNRAYNADMELIKAKESGQLVKITDVLLTSNLSDLNWFFY